MICWLLHERDTVSFRFGLSCMCSTYLWMPLLLKCIFMGLKTTFSSERLYDVHVLEVGFRSFKTWFYDYFRFASKIIIDIHELFFLQIYLSSKSLHFSVWSIRSCYIWRSSKTASIQKENTSLIRWVSLGKHVVFLFLSLKHFVNINNCLFSLPSQKWHRCAWCWEKTHKKHPHHKAPRPLCVPYST